MTSENQSDRIDLPLLTEREKLRRISEPDSMARMLDDVTKSNSERQKRAQARSKFRLYGLLAYCLGAILLASFFTWGELSGYWARHENSRAVAAIINNEPIELDIYHTGHAIIGLLKIAIFLVLVLFFFVDWLGTKLSWHFRKGIIHRIARPLLLIIGAAWIFYILFTIL